MKKAGDSNLPFVLDASATLPWCFKDEATPESDRLLAMARRGEALYVPAHWPAEVLQGLMRAVRRSRLEDDDVDLFLHSLRPYNVIVDARPYGEQWNDALPLIRTYQLSAYDAAYLGLAIHLQLPLATFDGKLRLAAEIEGVPLIV